MRLNGPSSKMREHYSNVRIGAVKRDEVSKWDVGVEPPRGEVRLIARERDDLAGARSNDLGSEDVVLPY
jgi:hypothetical protein